MHRGIKRAPLCVYSTRILDAALGVMLLGCDISSMMLDMGTPNSIASSTLSKVMLTTHEETGNIGVLSEVADRHAGFKAMSSPSQWQVTWYRCCECDDLVYRVYALILS
jgi:hypothetical protein